MTASPINSVYIVEPQNHGWIIERLMRDLAGEFGARGVAATIGTGSDYAGQTVILNSRYLNPFSDARAQVNALFITHVDDRLREVELKASFGTYSSLICISGHDAEFVAALKGDPAGVVGIDLPARDGSVRPVRVAMFSAFYEDGRKNEQWILDYFRDQPQAVRDNFVFCFLGWGWEPFCAALGALEMNYEIYRYSRFTPGEYDRYREVLAGMDELIYLGFDGGAMCVYDALSAGIGVIATNISYHRGLGEAVTLFDDREGFFLELDRLGARVQERRTLLKRRSISAYTDRLIAHWEALIEGRAEPAPPLDEPPSQTLAAFRGRYKRLGLSRIRSALIRLIGR